MSMAADQTEKKLDDLKRSQTNEDKGKKSKMECELNKRLCFLNKSIRACDEFLCRLFGVFGESNIKSGGGKVQKLPVPGVRKVVDEKLNISGGSSVKPKSNLIMPRLLKRVICNVCGFFGCHKTKGVDKQPNESKLSHADERDVDSSGGVQ
jgi:hypothetical protein